jgi:hypothetical protein
MINRQTSHGVFQRRQAAAIADRMRAQLALGDNTCMKWLCDRSEIVGGKPRSWRPAILTELGRLLEEQGPEVMTSLALQLCELKPRTKDALSIIRQARLVRAPNQSLELAAAIANSVEYYLQEHPQMTLLQVAEALEDARFYIFSEELERDV